MGLFINYSPFQNGSLVILNLFQDLLEIQSTPTPPCGHPSGGGDK